MGQRPLHPPPPSNFGYAPALLQPRQPAARDRAWYGTGWAVAIWVILGVAGVAALLVVVVAAAANEGETTDARTVPAAAEIPETGSVDKDPDPDPVYDDDDDAQLEVDDGAANAEIEPEPAEIDDTVEELSLPIVGSRQNPVPPGEQATFTVSAFGDANRSEWAVNVDGPGGDVTQAILDENIFNDTPAEGHVYFAVPITVTLEQADKEPLDTSLNFELDFFGSDSLSLYEGGFFSGCGALTVMPDAFPEFDQSKDVFIGGSVSGHVCFEVTEADAASGVMLMIDEGEPLFLATV